MFRRLHWELTGSFFVLFLIAFALAGSYVTPYLDNYLSDQTIHHLGIDTRVAVDVVKPLVTQTNPNQLENYVHQLGHDIQVRVTVIDPQGNVLAESDHDPETMENHASRPEMKQALQGKSGHAIRYSRTLKARMIYFAQPVLEQGKVIAVVRLALPLTNVQHSISHLLGVMALTIGFALLLSTVIAFLVAKRFVRPIRDLTNVAERIAEGDFEQRVDMANSIELDYLGRTVNYMAKRLKNTIGEISTERNKIKAIMTSLVDAVVALDENGRIILVNQRAENLFSQKEQNVLGKYLLELTRNQEVEQAFKEAIHQADEISKEIQLFPGERIVIDLNVVPIASDNGNVAGVVMVFRDVTELRSLEQMRTEFVANVSHELRTPLTSIKGFVETLLDGADSDAQIRQRFLNIISAETQRLHRLIDDLLSLSRLESLNNVDEARTDFNLILNKTLEVLVAQAKEKEIQLIMDTPDPTAWVAINEDMLGQVLINLLDNAIKYTPRGGRVTLKASAKQEQLLVQVQDTGIGIPEEALSRIFERFYRVDKARSRQVGGTGLGLSIVKHILETHGQRITVDSRYGQGTTFTFTLPMVN